MTYSPYSKSSEVITLAVAATRKTRRNMLAEFAELQISLSNNSTGDTLKKDVNRLTKTVDAFLAAEAAYSAITTAAVVEAPDFQAVCPSNQPNLTPLVTE